MEEIKKPSGKAVDLDVVASLIDRLDSLEKKNKELEGALEANNITDPSIKKELGNPCIKYRLYGGKMAKSWKTLSNISYVMGDKYICDQTMEVTFMDGTKTTMSFQAFGKDVEKIPVVTKRVEFDGREKTYVFDYEGKEVSLLDLFIN